MSVRVWVGVDAERLRALRDGSPLGGEVVAAESVVDQQELEARESAAEDGPVVVVAEVAQTADGSTADVTLTDVEALHVDADGSGRSSILMPPPC